ncbi:MAG: ribonuclease P protein component [Bacteroidales bacterium]|nr:ribonuclease P protein component [Bacteroidales bacterium]
MHKKFGLSRAEKLKSVVRTDKLFTRGKTFWTFPFNVYYRIGGVDDVQANQILVSVGKHYFKHAVDRNRMKRLVREAYRLNKLPLLEAAQKAGLFFNVGLVYKCHSLSDFDTVQNSIIQIIDHLKAIIERKKSK